MQTQVAANQPSSIHLATAGGKRRTCDKGKTKAAHRRATGSFFNPSIAAADDEWLNYRAAANLIGSTSGTLMVWISTGRYALPHYKIGRSVRFKRGELLRWLETRKRGEVQ